MKILHTVESYLPARHGMSEVVRQLSEGLVRQGHDVTVATSRHEGRDFTSLHGVQIASFDLSGNRVRGIKGNGADYVQFVKAGNFDIITCFAAQQWATDVLLPLIPELAGKKVFVPTGFSALHDPDYAEYFAEMPDWLRGFDSTVFLSETYQDAAFARHHHIGNTILIPNGASEEEFGHFPPPFLKAKLGIARSARLILHVGNFTGEKGHQEAIQVFLGGKIRNATLLLVGQNPQETLSKLGRRAWYWQLPSQRLLYDKKIQALALNREETVQAFKEADLLLFPSRIECSPVVLFEAAAAGTPFLATEVGNAREIAEWTGGGLMIPTQFRKQRGYADCAAGSRLLEKLVHDIPLRESMGRQARKAWQENFTWEKITNRYEELYKSLINS